MSEQSEDVFPAYRETISRDLIRHREDLAVALTALQGRVDVIAQVAGLLVRVLRAGNKILVAGNGGSAAEAQHFAAELVGRYRRERRAYPALALNADSATVTAIANDYGYENVFARQVAGLGRRGDVFIAFSTSGESENLVRAVETARAEGLTSVTATGGRVSRLGGMGDINFQAPSLQTPIVQEIHTIFTHLVCDLTEAELVRDEGG